jgi:alkanesulfonate monooxygenase SsuD/methylene tetrahydromethanopterin reductase-like flavin-dependent oxidoreductase (luciferase family)
MTTGGMHQDERRGMEVGVCFGPSDSVPAMRSAALLAEELGLDTVGFWDHYHAEQANWALLSGWSLYGYLAAITSRIRLVPMVICRPNYLLGVLAKETSMLQLVSDGRFEFGIGAGDYPREFTAWNVPFPDATERIAWLEETVRALRQIWAGEQVTMHGQYENLVNACCVPAPPVPPRVVVGVGGSRRLIDNAVEFADDINVYGKEDVVRYAAKRIAESARNVSLSIFAVREGEPPGVDALATEIATWRETGASRFIMTYGWADTLETEVRHLAAAKRLVHHE